MQKVVYMFGLFIVLTATFFSEIGVSIGKRQIASHRESIYTFGFLSMLFGTIMLILTAIFITNRFVFSLESLPTFGIRLLLEIAQAHIGIIAMTRADRSTFGFLRIITIPLLLAVDITLGYSIGGFQFMGIGLIIVSLVFLFFSRGIRRKGMWLVLFTAVNAVITISLFKYNITHFNSVEAEQSIIAGVLMLYFFIMAFFVAKENPIIFLKKPVFLIQSLAEGVGGVFMSFAYLFAPASIITTAKRSTSILWAMLSGNLYFHEKRLLLKLLSFLLITGGLIFLVI